jgi:hypothetical protein
VRVRIEGSSPVRAGLMMGAGQWNRLPANSDCAKRAI